MIRIDSKNQKKIMIEILKYFDSKCRENNINYSLIGGSLIGAIRHNGIIPWDDDVDVILTKKNYEKIINILMNDNHSKYKLLTHETCNEYFFPFPKLIDTTTYVVEPMSKKQISEYGIYIDIFCYNNISDNEKEKKRFIRKLKIINGLISRKKLDIRKNGFKKTVISFSRNVLSLLIGYNRLIKMQNNHLKKYEKNRTKYAISNWPIYSSNRELQLSENLNEYIDVSFENIKAMIFKNYDSILKTTFGDYMLVPPEEDRVSHGLQAYWKDQNEK